MVPSGLFTEHPSKESVTPRPPGRVHSFRMLGGAQAPSLMTDQAMRTARPWAPVLENHGGAR